MRSVLERSARRLGALARTAPTRLYAATRAQVPAGLRAVPALPLPADPGLAAEFYQGHYPLGGSTITCGPEGPFALRGAPEPWLDALHGFAWLRHFGSARGELYRVHARATVKDWIAQPGERLPAGAKPAIRAARLCAWIVNGPFLLQNAGPDFEREFLGSLGRQARSLSATVQGFARPEERLQSATVLCLAALALKGFESERAAAFALLERELDQQILPDGGHLSRSPQTLLARACDLLLVRLAAEHLRLELPRPIFGTLDRMLSMLRYLQHGDGGLATFNGVCDHTPALLRIVLDAAGETSSRIPARAPYSGYSRLAAGDTCLIADTGLPPPAGWNVMAAPAPGAFELSDGLQRLVVNCGAPADPTSPWASAARLTAAHSTAEIGAASAAVAVQPALLARLLGSPAYLGLTDCRTELDDSPLGSMISTVHDGYAGRFGCWHERRLFLSAGGADLRGEDRFRCRDGDVQRPEFAIRFHLHPSVRLSEDESQSGLRLHGSAGDWLFRCRGGQLSIEESVSLADHPAPQRTGQIVIRGRIGDTERVTWSFRKLLELPPETT
ncbi:MAG: heparinase II/III family protein [Hyphomicrobiales bacterium]